MSLPQPAVALTGICSVVYNNTLFTYSSAAFQSLQLAPGSKWKKLDPGVAVTGGVCVGSTPADASQAGFYVVGGKGTSAGYNGLQKYTYATNKWAAINPQSVVTLNRLFHAATYLNATDSIVMYGGSRDGSGVPSSDTYTIQLSAPYAVTSCPSTAPPSNNAILLPWSPSEALMVGGSTSNTQVMLFNPTTNAWTSSGSTLTQPFAKDTASLQAALITGDDNSKSLYTFDATVSPNQVERITLLSNNGQPVAAAAPVKRSLEDLHLASRATSALTLSDWPAYNATLAPTTTRSGFSLAQAPDGLVVLSGGGGSEVFCLFDGRKNSWVNASAVLAPEKKLVVTTSSASKTTSHSSTASSDPTTLLIAPTKSSATPTQSATSTSAAASAAPTPSTGLSANTILGIVLGAVGAVAFLVLILFLCIRRYKYRKQVHEAHSRRGSGSSSSEKEAFAIINDSLPVRPYGGSKSTFRGGHQAQDSHGSFSSMAILMGRVNQPRQSNALQRTNSSENNRNSAGSIFNRNFKSTISKPFPQTRPEASMSNIDASAFDRANGGGSGAGSAATATTYFSRSITDPKRASVVPYPQQSQQQRRQGESGEATRRSSGWNRYWSGGSALNMLGFGSGNNGNGPTGRGSKRTTVVSDASSTYSSASPNRITQDSATVPPLDIPTMPDAKPRFQRVNSGSPTIANYDNYIKDGLQGKIERSNSHNSTHSGYSSGIPASVYDTWDPTAGDRPWGANRAPSSAYSSSSMNNSIAPLPMAGGKKAYVSSNMSKQPQLAMTNTSSDMSWLNLGDVSGRV